LIAVLLLYSSGVLPAGAQADPITLEVEIGFDGYYRRDEWTPVRVTLANNGSDVEGHIVIDQGNSTPSEKTRYQLPIVLPGQSRKTVTLYPGVEGYQSRFTVELISGDETLASTRVSARQVAVGERLYLIASGELVDMAVLNQATPTGETAKVAYVTLDQLPAVSPVWDAVDLLILNDVDTGTLSPAQINAMRGWLASGGHLVLTGGPNWRKTAAGLDDLLPVDIQGTASVYDLGSLSALAPGEFTGGPFVVAQAALHGGRTLLAQDDLPLLVRRDQGLGTVDWLALDTALAPLRDWAGNERLWSIILAEPSGLPWDDSTINGWAAAEGLGLIPSLALPSALQMVAFLLIYIVLIGPVNYLILKRLQRRELAWITIPAIVLLFSGLAYVTGFQLKGGEVVINRLSLIYGAADSDTARARTLLGVFSPHRATYNLTIPEGVLVRPLVTEGYGGGLGSSRSTTIEQRGNIILRDVQIDVGRISAFQAESDVPALTVSADLHIDTSGALRLTGKVTNRADRPLQDAGIWIGDTIYELGNLEPGETVAIDEQLGGGRASPGNSGPVSGAAPYIRFSPPYLGNQIEKLIGGSDYWSDDKLNRRYQILQAFGGDQGISGLPHQQVTLFGWSEEHLWTIDVEGNESSTLDTAGYFMAVPISIAAGEEEIVVPPALTTWHPLDGNGAQSNGPYDYFLVSGWVTFQYQPWDTFQLDQVNELMVTVNASANQQGTIRVALWDWNDGTWVVDERIGWGTNAIADPAPYIGPSNAVRVRAENTSSRGYNLSMDVTFNGTLP
jgi:hypothetical protein